MAINFKVKGVMRKIALLTAVSLVMAAGTFAQARPRRSAPPPPPAVTPPPPPPPSAPAATSPASSYTPVQPTSGSNQFASPIVAINELKAAVRAASDYFNTKIPRGSKIVILNIQSSSTEFSDYIIDELIANAVNDRVFTVVSRKQLDAIRDEQKFQMSGEVDDNDAIAIGRFFGAQTIMSGVVSMVGNVYSLRINALNVQTAEVQGQYNRNLAISETLAGFANSSGSGSTYRSAGTTQAPSTGTAKPAEPPIQGTMVPGESLSEKLEWLKRSADSHNTYILEVTADENIAPHTFNFPGGINITVVLKGDNVNRTIRLKSNGRMFTISDKVTFILDRNVTLMGHNDNKSAMVYVEGGGIFKMNAGSTITGNHNYSQYGGVGGVYVSGTFEMNGGTISNNGSSSGGGVYIDDGWRGMCTFTMHDGRIIGNTARRYGGGVYIASAPTALRSGTFTMRGGTITGNTAHDGGGGVAGYEFVKTGGIITGYSSDQTNGNVVRDADGYTLSRKGHAVYVNTNIRKETTAGPNANMSYRRSKGATGGWDN